MGPIEAVPSRLSQEEAERPKRPRTRRVHPGEPRTGRNQDVNFRGERRSNDTHASTTDPMSFAKIKEEAKLSYRGTSWSRTVTVHRRLRAKRPSRAEAATMLGRERTRRGRQDDGRLRQHPASWARPGGQVRPCRQEAAPQPSTAAPRHQGYEISASAQGGGEPFG